AAAATPRSPCGADPWRWPPQSALRCRPGSRGRSASAAHLLAEDLLGAFGEVGRTVLDDTDPGQPVIGSEPPDCGQRVWHQLVGEVVDELVQFFALTGPGHVLSLGRGRLVRCE